VSSEQTPRTPSTQPDAQLPLQRETLRHSLRRANFAWVVIVAVIAALAFGVVWKAGQSEREAERANRYATDAGEQARRAGVEAGRARDASIRAEAELWNTRLAEARAIRVAGGPGARVKSSHAIRDLSHHVGLTETQRLALRAEAIAQLALVDLELPMGWTTQRNRGRPIWDSAYRRRVDSVGTSQVEILEEPSGKVLSTLQGPSGADRLSVRFSPDDRFLVGVFDRKSPVVLVWRLEDGGLTLSSKGVNVAGDEPPSFSPDSRMVAIPTSKGLELYELETGTVPRLFPGRWNGCFSPDSRKLAFALGTNVEIRSIETMRTLSRIETGFSASQVAWHPDGQSLAVGGREGELTMWELPDDPGLAPGQLRPLEGHAVVIVDLSFSPDGALLLSRAWDSFSCLWEVKSGRRLLAESRAALDHFSADGTRLTAEASMLAARTPARLLNRTGFRTVVQSARMPKFALGFAFSEDGRHVATDHHSVICVFDARTGRELARFAGRSPVFTSGGTNLLACTDRGVFRFDLQPARFGGGASSNWLEGVEILHRDRRRYPLDRFNTLALAADQRTVALSASEAGMVLFDLHGQTDLRRLTNTPSHYAGITPDNAWLVSQFHNGYTYLVNLTNTAKPIRLGYHLNTAFSPDGRRLGLATEEFLFLMERNSSNQWVRTARVPLDVGAGNPPALRFSPDSKSLAVVHNRFDIRLYDVTTARELATFVAPNAVAIGGVHSLGFSPDGRLLRALRRDGELVEWDIPVVRAELAKLGLDWSEATHAGVHPSPGAETSVGTASSELAQTRVQSGDPAPGDGRTPISGVAGRRSSPRSSLPAVAAGAAALIAFSAGVFVFIHQRRLLAAYGRADELAGKQQAQLAQAQNALFQSQKMEALGTLATGVAHDFNNLLSIIRMSNQLVARSVKPEGLTKENLDAVEQAVQQGKSIINSMLGYSRRPADTIEDFSVANVVDDTVALLSRQFLGGITLHLDLDRSCPQIHGSRTRLEQALLNLIVNASEAMKGSGALTVSVRNSEPSTGAVLAPKSASAYVAVCVADTGPGIPLEVLPRIFEPFFTTKNAGADRGTGLGLSLVYTIAKQDGWGLDVQTSPARGTSFSLLLPASMSDLRGRRLPTSPTTDHSGRMGSR
jgi:signal transduction histidine kinase